ncbi:MAG: ribosome silencing factor [Clostridia bacterium]|nr:ribosome silencing factor [Clostridia bacterium]
MNDNEIKLTEADPDELAKAAVGILDSKKAGGITVLKVTNQTVIADYFIICTGNSNTQIKSLSDELEFKLKERGIEPKNIEGFREASWIVMDYNSVIVHIFNRELREFYNLEKLWNDAEKIDISGMLPGENDEE